VRCAILAKVQWRISNRIAEGADWGVQLWAEARRAQRVRGCLRHRVSLNWQCLEAGQGAITVLQLVLGVSWVVSSFMQCMLSLMHAGHAHGQSVFRLECLDKLTPWLWMCTAAVDRWY
jgi:hypothetical protein